MLKLLVFLALLAAIAACYLRRPTRRSRAAPGASGDAPTDFRAVSVIFDQAEACDAVRELALKRFLCAESPALPLPDCTAGECSCRFEHHEDRRKGPRRADETGIFEPHFGGLEQRATPGGRRAEDLEDEAPDKAPDETPDEFDPTATYFDFIAQTGIDPQTSE